MAQAEYITTSIRELMSRGWPPKSTSPVRAAHTELVTALASNPPHPIHVAVESDNLDGRADHLEKVLAVIHVYLTAISDTRRTFPATRSTANTSTTSTWISPPTRLGASAVQPKKCASMRLGGRHDPLSQTSRSP